MTSETLRKPEPFAHTTMLVIVNPETNEERSCTQAEFDETFGPAGWQIVEPVTAQDVAEAELAAPTNETDNADAAHRSRRRRSTHEGD